MNIKAYGYISPNYDHLEQSRFFIEWCAKRGYEYVSDVYKINTDQKDDEILLFYDISCIGRSLKDFYNQLCIFQDKRMKVRTVYDIFSFGLDHLGDNLFMSALKVTYAYDDLIRKETTNQGLSKLVSLGGSLGRPYGSKNKKKILSGKEERIKALLKEGYSKRKIAQMLNVCYNTLYNYCRTERIS